MDSERGFFTLNKIVPKDYSQNEKITVLRKQGYSYSKIADTLGVSINTIKSFCQRNNLGGVASKNSRLTGETFCKGCSKSLKQTSGKKQKIFCSDKCRMTWWNSHPEKVNRKTIRSFICKTCGDSFESYGSRERKYCSRKCYGQSKRIEP
jgi:hypothetical protein